MRRIGRSLVLAALVATACRDGAKTEPVAVLKTEISLQEAIALGTEAVGVQDGPWRLTRVHSYDNDSVRSAASGADGSGGSSVSPEKAALASMRSFATARSLRWRGPTGIPAARRSKRGA